MAGVDPTLTVGGIIRAAQGHNHDTTVTAGCSVQCARQAVFGNVYEFRIGQQTRESTEPNVIEDAQENSDPTVVSLWNRVTSRWKVITVAVVLLITLGIALAIYIAISQQNKTRPTSPASISTVAPASYASGRRISYTGESSLPTNDQPSESPFLPTTSETTMTIKTTSMLPTGTTHLSSSPLAPSPTTRSIRRKPTKTAKLRTTGRSTVTITVTVTSTKL